MSWGRVEGPGRTPDGNEVFARCGGPATVTELVSAVTPLDTLRFSPDITVTFAGTTVTPLTVPPSLGGSDQPASASGRTGHAHPNTPASGRAASNHRQPLRIAHRGEAQFAADLWRQPHRAKVVVG